MKYFLIKSLRWGNVNVTNGIIFHTDKIQFKYLKSTYFEKSKRIL